MLYIVAGPIGNLKDITFRAIETLKEADLILCEDTRRTGLLLKHFNIAIKMESYHEHNELDKLPRVLQLLEQGKNIALFSDAGTPTISDPGFKLVRAAYEKNIPVSPIPGPSAAIAALSASGQPTDSFVFLGFLPRQQGRRIKIFEKLKEQSIASSAIIYESPYRIDKILEDIATVFGSDVQVTICNELTKLYEKIIKDSVDNLIKKFKNKSTRGEFTIILNIKQDGLKS